jgi:hypothetical protein
MQHPEVLMLGMAQATRKAVLDHKFAGNSVAIWREGKVVILQPEEIEISTVPNKPL